MGSVKEPLGGDELPVLDAHVEGAVRSSSMRHSRWRARWLRIDAFLQLANTYFASRMAVITLVSCVTIVLLWVFSDDRNVIWAWAVFQVTNALLGLSALPRFRLFSVASRQPASQEETQRDSDSIDGAPSRDRRASFAFLRSSFYAIENKLEPLLLKRSAMLRLCETIVVVQSALWYYVVVMWIIMVWFRRGHTVSATFTASALLGLVAVICVFIQTKEFDRLRAHEQLQLGFGLDHDLIAQAHAHKKRPSSSSRIYTSFVYEDSMQNLRSHRSQVEGSQYEDSDDVLDLGHVAAVVEKDLRRGLYEAAVHRDQHKARSLLQVLERALGSKVKVELLLLKMYASPTLWLWSFAFTTHNPLHVACRLGDEGMVRVLLEGGMNPNLLDKTQGEPFSLRLVYEVCQGRPKNITNVLGAPLHVAVAYGHTHLIDLLVKFGASLDVLAQTSFFSRSMRVPPVFLADSADVLESLIHHRANFLVVPGKGNSMSVTVLQRAMLNDRSELESVLKEWGADVALTPLHEASAAGDLATVKHYLALGIPPDQLGEFQDGVHCRTPLHWASIMGRRAVIVELLAHNANVDALDSYGRTPLHWAARHNHVETVKELLAAGANPTLPDDDGLTPLAFSAVGGLLDGIVVELFMAAGVNVNERLPNRSNDTCLHLALRMDHHEAAVALVESGHADLNAFNGEGLCAIECCASAELQFAVKQRSGWVDIVISHDTNSGYTPLAERVKRGIEESFLTVSMRSTSDSEQVQQSMNAMKEASAVVCVLTSGFEKSTVCMEELAFAKVNQVPVVAITTESMNLPEELQVYLFTRQLVPFRDAITKTDNSHADAVDFTIDEQKFVSSLQSLIDGLRDEVELHRLAAAEQRLVDPDMQSSVDVVESMDLPRPTSASIAGQSDATSQSQSYSSSQARISEVGRGGSTPNLNAPSGIATSPPDNALFSRSETYRRRTLDEIVRDVLGRRRHVRPTPQSLLPTETTPTHTDLSVFLSHGDCHEDFVARIHKQLKRNRIPVKLDSMAKVSSMKERILAAKDAILQCSVFLVVLSEQSVKTELVSDQLAFAEDKGKHIVPVYYTRRPRVVDSTVAELLDFSASEMLILGDDLSYGRGVDALLEELPVDKGAIEVEEESRQDDSDAELSPVSKKIAQHLLHKSRLRHAQAERHSSILF